MEIISRKEAKEQGLKYYYTGNPCPKGHIYKRFTSAGTCSVCAKKYKQEWAKSNFKKVQEYRREYKQNNKPYFAKHERTRKASKIQRTPSWANQEEIIMWYEVAEVLSRSGVVFHVDHIVPLQGKTVSGLHVEDNLQVLRFDQNCSKKNQWNWETQSYE